MIHEVKHDGYRVQLHKSGRSAVIYSKNGREFSNRFPGILHALLGLPCKSSIIDAEVVALKEDGSTDFRALHSGNYTQRWPFPLLVFVALVSCGRPYFRQSQCSEGSAR